MSCVTGDLYSRAGPTTYLLRLQHQGKTKLMSLETKTYEKDRPRIPT